MKLALLAATALAFSTPLIAQETTAPSSPDTMTTQDPAMAPPAADPMMQTAPSAGTMTPGGYAPGAPPMAASSMPGAQVVFRASMPVAQAFPPPPPKDSYPLCTRTMRDACRNPGES